MKSSRLACLTLALCLAWVAPTELNAQADAAADAGKMAPTELIRRMQDLEKEVGTLRAQVAELKQQAGAATTPAATTTSSSSASTPAAPAAPPSVLTQVLGSTTLSGFVDTYYGYNFNQPASRTNSFRAFDVDAALKYTFQRPKPPAVCREFGEFDYKAGTWPHKRRVIVKAEITRGELNPRFVVTDLGDGMPEERYAFYCARGDRENRIKEMKLDLASGRTSCHRFLANQFRLLLHTAACVLMQALQEAASGTRWAKAQIGTLRLRLLKVGARVVETCRKVWVHLPTAFPEQDVWYHIHDRLCRLQT